MTSSAIKNIFLSLLFLSVTVSCRFSAADRPIANLRLNTDTEKPIFLGQEVKLTGDLALEQPISEMQLVLKSSKGEVFAFDQTLWERGVGKSDYRLSENVTIPGDMRPGKYFLVLSVTSSDKESYTDSIPVQLAVDSSMPVAGHLDVGINSQKNDLHLEAELAAVKKIDRVTISVQGSDWSTEKVFDKPSLTGQLSVNFHEHMHVSEAPEGKYTVTLTVYDQDGRKAVSQGSFSK